MNKTTVSAFVSSASTWVPNTSFVSLSKSISSCEGKNYNKRVFTFEKKQIQASNIVSETAGNKTRLEINLSPPPFLNKEKSRSYSSSSESTSHVINKNNDKNNNNDHDNNNNHKRPERNPPRRLTGPRSPSYHANVGFAIETLREEYPRLLECPPTTAFFTSDVKLNLYNFQTLYGLNAYRNFHWALRIHLRVFFRPETASLTIQSMYHEDREGALYVRWRLAGVPRTHAAFQRTTRDSSIDFWKLGANQRSSFVDDGEWSMDGMSIYRFDQEGNVCEQEMDSSIMRKISDESRAWEGIFERVVNAGKMRVPLPNGIPGSYGLNTGNWFSQSQTISWLDHLYEGSLSNQQKKQTNEDSGA